MKIGLTHAESELYFHNALCNGLQELYHYNLDIKYSNEEFKEAKKNLISNGVAEAGVCYEDVLLEMLKMGFILTLVDVDDNEDSRTITLKEVHDRVSLTPTRHLMNMINQEDDAITADVILQTVFLEDIVYG